VGLELAEGVLNACSLPGEELTGVLGVHGGKYGPWRAWLPVARGASDRGSRMKVVGPGLKRRGPTVDSEHRKTDRSSG
jgi:hypothetical protein